MSVVYDGRYQVFKVAGMGPYDNNGYVVADPGTREAYLVDAPAEFARLLDAARGAGAGRILVGLGGRLPAHVRLEPAADALRSRVAGSRRGPGRLI